ncbi:efflux RND transporter periplasmic adaptor subunit [Pseudomarimonas arenosa]|uniref:Efflux RND transporter periplasmic adaptor subunit n=1 Tax=Pseudomarimonas arenosa TaxID=2774145 RepID=A0AAW3ZN24_9GAMM|nr:efflux RND transporter periplasmic adaptor subunit [Pseudomarimonas arenosa]MBD8526472.1 efflux RND transporter periplasmic adaptor subunit [Pseudomarimonas arenosa]
MANKHGVLIAMLVTLALPAGRLAAQNPGPPPANVAVGVALEQTLSPLQWSPASVVSRRDARVAAEQAGRVTEMAEIGQVIAAGAVLARLDDRQLRLAVQDAKAAEARIAARLDYARAQEKRMESLVGQSTVSRAQLDEVSAERRMQEQDLAAAKVAVKQAELRLTQSTVRAPFAGTVVERLVEVGEFLSAGSPVVRLVDTVNLEAQVRAPVQLAGFVKQGDALQLRQGDWRAEHPVRAVVPVGDATSRQFELRVALPPSALPIGAALDVGLPSAMPSRVVTVPRDAIVLRPGERYVVRVAEGNVAERVTVSVGTTMDDRVAVTGAVAAGDQLVIRGAERVQPGQALNLLGAGEELAAGGL